MTTTLLDRFRLDGRVAAITGGASGIGLATAVAMRDAGAAVWLLYRDGTAATREADRLGGKALAMDMADDADVDAGFAHIAAQAGRLDILVNNAGTAIRRPSVELSRADWQTVVDVNMTGAFLCARAAARHMLAFGHGGAIVNTASIMGLSGGGLYPNISYQTTKGAIVNMTRALAVEWAKQGIRVNAVAPTWVRTGFIAPLLGQPDVVAEMERVTPMGRLADPEDVATAILFLASRAAGMVTGHTLAVDGGFLAQ